MTKPPSSIINLKLTLLLKLNQHQLDRLSEILGNFGLLLFASMVIPVFTYAQIDYFTILSGLITSIGSIIGSLLILKGGAPTV